MRYDPIERLAVARSFFAKLWRLTRPYFVDSDERGLACGILAVLIGMNVFLVWLLKELNDWNARFFDALQDKDAASFWRLLLSFESFGDFFFSFTGLVLVYIVVAVYRLWLRQYLTIRWRRWLTHVYCRDWLADRTYYRMELVSYGTDNPEQRIEQDIRSYTESTLVIAIDLLREIMTLVTFTVVLWQLSGSVVLPFLGGIELPGYMLWTAIVYAVLGSWLTWLIGRRLVAVNFALERYNADFRYRMIRVRENAESIALYRGEPDEVRRLGGAFDRIYDVWWDYMKLNKRLTWLTVFYGQMASVFPIVVQAPRYFAGTISLGTMTQTAGAFGQVQGSLSWFVDSFATLANWKAVVDRLTTFADAMAVAKQRVAEEHAFAIETVGTALELRDVTVRLPDGRPLLEDVDLTVRPGEAVVVQGPSGSGKTTLFRVLAGLWPFGSGTIRTPEAARVLFLPQKPYLPIGTLREALTYPEPPGTHPDERLREVLTLCRLEHLAERLDESANWSLGLSPGEQQRLAFARALLYRPDWLFMDEATAALDAATETRLYGLLREQLPEVTMVSIAHKPSVLRFHDRRLRIEPTTRRVHLEPIEADSEAAE